MSAHYLQPLQKTTLPSRHVIFDTETQLSRRAGALEHRYATGAAQRFHHPDIQHPANVTIDCLHFENPKQLWEWIAGQARKGHRTVAWAHNLSFDLRVSEALRWLPRQGFKLEGIVLERTASWASWSSEHGSLLCCDLYAWLPRTLDDIAKEMGVKRETWSGERYEQATLPELQNRCFEDVQITRRAVQILLQWLQDEDCGPFRPTGSGQAHACWRKQFRAGKITMSQENEPHGGIWVHDNPNLRSLEREAMWTGRCEAWKHGEITGPLYEYDMNLAYCRIAANHQLPVKHRGEHGNLGIDQLRELIEGGYAIMAEVDIKGLEQPIVPCRVGERILWPIGDFTTILWDPELVLVPHDAFRVKRCWSYDTGPALKPMAEWIIGGLGSLDTPAPMRLLLKHWARALIGRMALRYRRWEDYGTMPDLGLALWVGYDEEGLPVENLQVGHDRFWLAELTETETSVPQITGWVMSQCRAQLWRFIEQARPHNVLYMDTDSLLVSGCGAARLIEADNLMRKAKWDYATIHGPRNLELDIERRLSGIPRTATRKGPLEYEGTVMRGIKESIIRDELDHVAQLSRPYHVSDTDPRREHCPDGSTQPYCLGGVE